MGWIFYQNIAKHGSFFGHILSGQRQGGEVAEQSKVLYI